MTLFIDRIDEPECLFGTFEGRQGRGGDEREVLIVVDSEIAHAKRNFRKVGAEDFLLAELRSHLEALLAVESPARAALGAARPSGALTGAGAAYWQRNQG